MILHDQELIAKANIRLPWQIFAKLGFALDGFEHGNWRLSKKTEKIFALDSEQSHKLSTKLDEFFQELKKLETTKASTITTGSSTEIHVDSLGEQGNALWAGFKSELVEIMGPRRGNVFFDRIRNHPFFAEDVFFTLKFPMKGMPIYT